MRLLRISLNVDFEWHLSKSDIKRYHRKARFAFKRAKKLGNFRKRSCLTEAEDVREGGSSLSQFTCFGQLPSELRAKIWRHVSSIPRNVDIRTTDFGGFADAVDEVVPWFATWKYYSRTPPPSILSVCRESRIEGLKHYKLEFGTSFTFRDCKFSTSPRIYINFNVDRICCMESYYGGDETKDYIDFTNRCLMNGTRYLALNLRFFQRKKHWEQEGYDVVKTTILRYADLDPDVSPVVEEVILFDDYNHSQVKGALEFKDFSDAADMEDGRGLLGKIGKWLVQAGIWHEDGEAKIEHGPRILLKYVEVGGNRIRL